MSVCRFGSARWGFAAVVALIHDIFITIGAIALCHYLADTSIGKWRSPEHIAGHRDQGRHGALVRRQRQQHLRRDRVGRHAQGDHVRIDADAPHQFTNKADRPARLLCVCAPAGQEEFFAAIGVPVPGRTTPPPKPDKAAQAAFQAKAEALAPQFRTELLTSTVERS